MKLQRLRLTSWLASSSAPVVERTLETHLSTVLLADYAYKIRKPVHFPFIDQRTPELRYAAASRELALGRTFSPQIYVGIHYLTSDGYLDPGGACPDEPVLVMARVPAKLCASSLLPTADSETIHAFADGLVDLHASLQRVPPEEAVRNIRYAWETNFRVMSGGEGLPVSAAELGRIHQEVAQRFQDLEPTIVQRAASGYARVCHGDLQLDHVFLTRPLSLIDPLDYDPRLCSTDVLAELAFPIMGLLSGGHDKVAAQLAEAYGERSGQGDGGPLLWFFVSYRALVRAKVEWLRSCQVDGCEKAQALARSRQLVELSRRALASAAE